MKIRKLTVLFIAILFSGGTMLYAASNSSVISVYINNVLQDKGGLSSDGETYLSLSQLSDNLHSLIAWDESKKMVKIYKPNVNIALLDSEKKIFGAVKNGSRNTFTVFVQIDNLKTEISDLKITISNPGNETDTIQTQHIEEQKEKFWFRSSEFTYTFNTKGDYPILVYLKDTVSKEWALVGEIQLSVV
ncbi:copper amine oxidase [Paenibacillus nasutitermitis]|uniref:Copper amine oxidase n=1 Tax=Paenibacillus nasutitermitis TaxID=1652958 RepID=A0A916Z9L0_9BACL|nr:copper amine oxidase [Paenibacillus nasutitermitis]GGD81646.1 hypothetical protein GCM10010911_44710 [Paenibacillus nasutitermitis]